MNDKKLTKSLDKRMICGVCGGISEYFGIDVTLVRLLWVLISVFTAAAGLVAYIIAAIIMPEAQFICINHTDNDQVINIDSGIRELFAPEFFIVQEISFIYDKKPPAGCTRFCCGIMSLNATQKRRRISRFDILCSAKSARNLS